MYIIFALIMPALRFSSVDVQNLLTLTSMFVYIYILYFISLTSC